LDLDGVPGTDMVGQPCVGGVLIGGVVRSQRILQFIPRENRAFR
jgi:hypothetical protein